MSIPGQSSIDQQELEKFNRTEQEWWNQDGEFKALHAINLVRIEYITSVARKYFDIVDNKKSLLGGLKLIGIGCGGGLICAPMSELGTEVTGLDANEHNIKAVTSYVKRTKLNIEYINNTIEEYIKSPKKYDIVLCLEVIEHVANQKEFVNNISKLVAPGGVLIFSTINRTKKAFFLAIMMAEYVLRWVPRQTHNYSKFIRPSEFVRMLEGTTLGLSELKGLTFAMLSQNWYLSNDIDVNYFAFFTN